jgi:hypothetical protein
MPQMMCECGFQREPFAGNTASEFGIRIIVVNSREKSERIAALSSSHLGIPL